MKDIMRSRPQSLEDLWERYVEAARRSWYDAEDSDYFDGQFQAHMADLADLAFFMGKTREYAMLCREEFSQHPWMHREDYED